MFCFQLSIIVFSLAIIRINCDDSYYNPEAGEYFQGDILGIDPSKLKVNEKGIAMLPLIRQLWTNGIVPYYIDPAYNSTERKQILSGMKYLEDMTRANGRDCIKFVPFTMERNWIKVFPGTGCYSAIGRDARAGEQVLSLARPGCLVNAIVAHEFMHALGILHEQSRPDRDDYVEILFENIEENLESNFVKLIDEQVQTFDEPYDYDSVMHYNTKDFSKNGQPTIVPKEPGVVIGQRKYLSEIDVREIRKLYSCA